MTFLFKARSELSYTHIPIIVFIFQTVCFIFSFNFLPGIPTGPTVTQIFASV